jgi:hypothetical protein
MIRFPAETIRCKRIIDRGPDGALSKIKCGDISGQAPQPRHNIDNGIFMRRRPTACEPTTTSDFKTTKARAFSTPLTLRRRIYFELLRLRRISAPLSF